MVEARQTYEKLARALPGLHLELGPMRLPDVEGAWRLAEVAPRVHAAGADVRGKTLAVDLTCLGSGFAHQQLDAEVLSVDWPPRQGVDARPHDTRPSVDAVPFADALFGRSFAVCAARLDASSALFDALEAALVAALEGREGDAIRLPPVLGLTHPEALRVRLEARLGRIVYEALDALPSTHGLRLERALHAAADAAGVDSRQRRVERVDPLQRVVHTPTETWRPGAVVWATGGSMAGGLTDQGAVREPLADLPLDTPSLGAPSPEQLTALGVRVDAGGRVLDAGRAPFAPGLFACGDVTGRGVERGVLRAARDAVSTAASVAAWLRNGGGAR
jgi:anaerobic glycerol-3-phosphate dehydrogenase